jgi:hypothetical protein
MFENRGIRPATTEQTDLIPFRNWIPKFDIPTQITLAMLVTSLYLHFISADSFSLVSCAVQLTWHASIYNQQKVNLNGEIPSLSFVQIVPSLPWQLPWLLSSLFVPTC